MLKVTVTFTYVANGQETPATFEAKLNKLTGDWIYTFDAWKNAFVSNLTNVKQTVRNIQKHAKNVEIKWQEDK